MPQQCLIDMKAYMYTCIATCISGLCILIGTDTPAFKFLLALMVADYISGLVVGALRKSKKTKSGGLASPICSKGLARKGHILLIIAIAVHLETIMQVQLIGSITIGWYIAAESLSIIENGGLIGVKYPKRLKKALDILYNEEEDKK